MCYSSSDIQSTSLFNVIHTVKKFHVLLCITYNSIKHQSFVYPRMMKYFYLKQFNLAQVICLHTVQMSNSSIRLIDRTLSNTSTLGQSGPGSDGKEGKLCIPIISCITAAYPFRLFNIISSNSLGGSYPFTEMQSVYSTSPGDWAQERRKERRKER